MRRAKSLLKFSKVYSLGVFKNGAKRALCTQAQKIIYSPYPEIQTPEMSVIEYVWKDLGKWSDKTAVVGIIFISGEFPHRRWRWSLVTSRGMGLRNDLLPRETTQKTFPPL